MSGPRRILITGASRGLGRALVDHYLALGDRVIGCARGESDVSHERYKHHRLDAASESAVADLFRTLRGEEGGLDVLINNAGVASMNPIALMPVDTARRITETNFLAVFILTRAAVRLLKASGAGRIVNLTTVAAPLRLEGEAVYAASKSAVETFTRITAREVGRWGITCNAVGPSPVKTALTEAVPKEKMDALIARQAIPRWASTGDVANVIDFFLRPESGMVTGQVLYLGGIG